MAIGMKQRRSSRGELGAVEEDGDGSGDNGRMNPI
jgi:hypothetical protein